MEACLQGERGTPPAKAADPVLSSDLIRLPLALDANGDPRKDEATVGRELTGLRPVLLYSQNADLPGQLAQVRMLQELAVAEKGLGGSMPEQSHNRRGGNFPRGLSISQSSRSLGASPNRLRHPAPMDIERAIALCVKRANKPSKAPTRMPEAVNAPQAVATVIEPTGDIVMCPQSRLTTASLTCALCQYPVRTWVMAGVAVGIVLKIILMLGLCFPEIAYRFEFRYHLARP